MGKALVFNGITVASPVGTVTFTDGLSAPVQAYIDKLSTPVTKAQKGAFQAFYQTLLDAGIWDKVTYLYPMFGSVADCAHGMVGGDLSIPAGAAYDRGLDLTAATGGYGYLGRGVKVAGKFPADSRTNYSHFFSLPYGWGAAARGFALVYGAQMETGESNDRYRALGPGYNSLKLHTTIALGFVDVEDGWSGLFGECHDFGNMRHAAYHDGDVIKELSGNYNSTTYVGAYGINASPQNYTSHLLNVPVNMIVASDGHAFSGEEVAVLAGAVKTLSAVIF